MKITQNDIAEQAGVTPSFLSRLLAGERRPNWQTAKRLAAATGTDPVLWLEAEAAELRRVVDEIKNAA